MRDDLQYLVFLTAGVLGSILLGIALIPLRESTHSGNFIFLFVILIIVVSEYAGRWAAIATAACSALSLNFFLTRPYLSLRIEGTHDIIAFVGLTLCGLLAATLGSRHSATSAALREARVHLGLLHAAARLSREAEPLAARLEEVLRSTRDALPLAGLVLRNSLSEVIATSGRAPAPRPAPPVAVRSDTLLPEEQTASDPMQIALPLPVEGATLALEADGRPAGWLDLWGNGKPASPEARRTLSDMARILATMIAR